MTLQGLKNNSDVVFTESDRKKTKEVMAKKDSSQIKNKEENSLPRTAVEYISW